MTTDPTAAPRTFRLSWAEAKGPLGRAALALWLPALAAFVASPLAECDHCVRNYLAILPVFPGFFAGIWLGHGVWAIVLAGAATLVLLALLATLFGVAGRRWPWLAVPVALVAGAQAIGLGHLLRM